MAAIQEANRYEHRQEHLKKTILYLKEQELIWKMIKLTYILRIYVMHVVRVRLFIRSGLRPLYSFDSTQPLGCLGGSVVRASV